MKKLLNTAFVYAVAAMAGGVFYREFTKWNGFTGVTALGKVHTHLFMLGMVMFLIAALFAQRTNLMDIPRFRKFFIVYNIGVPLTAVMLIIRGIPQVLNIPLTKGMDAAISGCAGIGHILTGIGILLLLSALQKTVQD